MADIRKSSLELIGGTPLLEAGRYSKKAGVNKAVILAKLEYLNPAGSVKDRIALAMIEDAEKRGILKPGATIIEPTSGNTEMATTAVAAAKGYRAILTLPDTMSIERRNLLKAYGAELVLTEGSKGMKGAIAKAEELNREIEGSVILGQFINPANPKIHKETTGPEISGNRQMERWISSLPHQNRRNHYWCGRILKGTESGYPDCSSGTSRKCRIFQGNPGSP